MTGWGIRGYVHQRRIKRFLEFFVIGIVFGVTEDMLAVLIATDAELSFDILVVVFLIAIPFAVFSELVVDHPEFLHFDKLAMHFDRRFVGTSTRDRSPGQIDRDTMPAPHHEFRCAICGRSAQSGAILHEHLERRHPGAAIQWEVTAHRAR